MGHPQQCASALDASVGFIERHSGVVAQGQHHVPKIVLCAARRELARCGENQLLAVCRREGPPTSDLGRSRNRRQVASWPEPESGAFCLIPPL